MRRDRLRRNRQAAAAVDRVRTPACGQPPCQLWVVAQPERLDVEAGRGGGVLQGDPGRQRPRDARVGQVQHRLHAGAARHWPRQQARSASTGSNTLRQQAASAAGAWQAPDHLRSNSREAGGKCGRTRLGRTLAFPRALGRLPVMPLPDRFKLLRGGPAACHAPLGRQGACELTACAWGRLGGAPACSCCMRARIVQAWPPGGSQLHRRAAACARLSRASRAAQHTPPLGPQAAPDRSSADMLENWLRLPHTAGRVEVIALPDRSRACILYSPEAPDQLAGRVPLSLQPVAASAAAPRTPALRSCWRGSAALSLRWRAGPPCIWRAAVQADDWRQLEGAV